MANITFFFVADDFFTTFLMNNRDLVLLSGK